ncbi:ATP-dependent 6-phosphofructokinase [Sediminispirochaeta bajacaliforniensis]|uniref:ATP-dependent 6-phosphofructokinase n=1 Tax=Sediminispirochaeta bajacaliforniensis TaxID=148 RepID=UPI0003694904|nr:ATP-dependent 6-phosphofructokinase [Sediminispirochaeta bajacaliforniensis]
MPDNFDFSVPSLGEPNIQSPIKMSTVKGDSIANYVSDSERILFEIDAAAGDTRGPFKTEELLERAGPREKVYFNPAHVHAAVVTCGGLCPGLNNVVRAIVRCLWYSYGIKRITGIKNGYRGFLSESNFSTLELDPEYVDDIQARGGTVLGSARGGGDRVGEIADAIERLNINMLFTIGGDGTQRGALEIAEELERRALRVSVIGIPKTIDNDLSFIQRSFGFETAVEKAVDVVRGAHVEAHDTINGIGLVKVMGRESGFIAAYAALAMSDVNFCLIPESPFDLDGPNGLLESLRKRLLDRNHAVILVAEGAGQELVSETGETDLSGNKRLADIGVFLKEKIKAYFKSIDMEVNIKYIDPSYIIRSSPANPNDSIYCSRLGAHAVHAAMAGKTKTLMSMVNNTFVHLPMRVAVSKRKHVNTEGSLWRDVVENTRQPVNMCDKGEKTHEKGMKQEGKK